MPNYKHPVVTERYQFFKSVKGKELHKEIEQYVNLYFLDETDLPDKEPMPVNEFRYWIERNQQLDFDLYTSSIVTMYYQ